jgi:hypothetical protein
MDSKAGGHQLVTAFSSRVVEVLARCLDGDERAAVLGDFEELGTRGVTAMSEMAGLVLRRHAACWATWQAWFTLAAIVIPMGALLSFVSRWWADSSAPYSFIYLNHGSVAQLSSPGARAELLAHFIDFALRAMALACWSWTVGFALARVSRKTAWVSGLLLGLVLFGATAGTSTTARGAGNSVVFSLAFYRVAFPALWRSLFVQLPLWTGILAGCRGRNGRLSGTTFVPVAAILLMLVTARSLEYALTFGRNVIPANAGPDGLTGTQDDPRPVAWVPVVVTLPAATILLASAYERSARRREDS